VTTNLGVIVGGGGVGKTTVAASLALARARAGARTLVITVDPAQRLADALGVHVGIDAMPVQIDGVQLHARMPDSRRSVDQFAAWLFAEHPQVGDRVRANPLYRELADALVGMHEMVCVAIVNQELESGAYDEVILDTAPTRHALEFLDYPQRLVEMLEARTMRWVAAMAAYSSVPLDGQPRDRGLLAWGKRRIQALLAKVAGSLAIQDVSALFNDLTEVRGRWLSLLHSVQARLASPDTRYLVVSTPAAASLDEAGQLLVELGRRGYPVSGILLNRLVDEVPQWLTGLQPPGDSTLSAVHQAYVTEYGARARQSELARHRLTELGGAGIALWRLPALQTTDPRAILTGLADALGAGATP
jgi:anion-transporting  ArsA/GET3 family ATPase